MTDRELLQQVLEALDSDDPTIQLRTAVALRAALAEPEQRCEYIRGNGTTHWCALAEAGPRREWVGLTPEERHLGEARSAEEIAYAQAIEAKLKEKNNA